MADQTGQNPAVTDTQPAPVPSVEQKTPVEAPAEATPQPESRVETETSAPDRTREQFDKLTTSNKELKGQLDRERQEREKLQGMIPQPQPQQPQKLYDPDTGYLDPNALDALQRQAAQAEQRAIQAEQRSKQVENDRLDQEAFTSHPELQDGAENFDAKLRNQVRATVLDSMVNPADYGGSQLTPKQAADLVKGTSTKDATEAEKQGAQQALEELTPKEQASLEAIGSSSQGRQAQRTQDQATLQRATRKGNLDAIMERMRGTESS